MKPTLYYKEVEKDTYIVHFSDYSDIIFADTRRKLIGKLSNKEVGQLLIKYLPEREVWYVSMDMYGICKEQHTLDTFELAEEKYKEFLNKIEKQNVLYVL